jgi:hypothetical protein
MLPCTVFVDVPILEMRIEWKELTGNHSRQVRECEVRGMDARYQSGQQRRFKD